MTFGAPIEPNTVRWLNRLESGLQVSIFQCFVKIYLLTSWVACRRFLTSKKDFGMKPKSLTPDDRNRKRMSAASVQNKSEVPSFRATLELWTVLQMFLGSQVANTSIILEPPPGYSTTTSTTAEVHGGGQKRASGKQIQEAGNEKGEDCGAFSKNVLKELHHQRELLTDIARSQKKLLATGPPTAVDPVTDDEARRLFALLRALELESKFHKAPVTRVFILYCLDGKSRDAVARDCNCSPALITLRLKAIKMKLGRKPIELRQFSDQFERIADSLSDSRARRIDRRRAIDGDDPDDEF
jgi:hypothetical protein